jgi:hypothetical protein
MTWFSWMWSRTHRCFIPDVLVVCCTLSGGKHQSRYGAETVSVLAAIFTATSGSAYHPGAPLGHHTPTSGSPYHPGAPLGHHTPTSGSPYHPGAPLGHHTRGTYKMAGERWMRACTFWRWMTRNFPIEICNLGLLTYAKWLKADEARMTWRVLQTAHERISRLTANKSNSFYIFQQPYLCSNPHHSFYTMAFQPRDRAVKMLQSE